MKKVINVLVCDDNIIFTQQLTNFLLKSNEYIRVCGIAYNGEEAIDVVKKLNPDVIILDLDMPIMNGYDLLRRINLAKDYNVTVIIITGIECDIKELIKYKFVYDVIFKGITYENLVNRINNIIIQKSDVRIKERILSELIDIGFKGESKSTMMLLKAVCIAMNDEHNDYKIMKNVFKELELQENVKYSDIISNIQKAIDTIWLNSNQEYLCKKLKIPVDTKPTVKFLLYYLVNKFN